MQNASSDRIAKLTAELKEVQAMLSERQRELLRAISGNGPGQDVLRRQVRALGYCAMGIIAEIEQELLRRRGLRTGRVAATETETDTETDGAPLTVPGQGQGARAPGFSLRGHFAG
jgi:hypothetical protein